MHAEMRAKMCIVQVHAIRRGFKARSNVPVRKSKNTAESMPYSRGYLSYNLRVKVQDIWLYLGIV